MTKVLAIIVSFLVIMLFLSIESGYAFGENIVAAWLMDEGSGKFVTDYMANYDDAPIEGKAEWVDGKFGGALEFDGSGSHVQVPFSAAAHVLNQSDFTFAMWFKAEALPDDRSAWIAGFQQMDNNGTGRTWMGLQDGTNLVYSALGNIRPLGTAPEVGVWSHFALVITEDGANNNLQLYSDGVMITEMALSVEDCEGDYLIGCHKNLNALNSWEGAIDEVVMLNKALEPDELNQLINDGVSTILAVEGRHKLATTWGNLKSY